MNIRNVLRLGTLFSFSAIISGGLVWSVSARAASNLFSVSHSAIECKPMCGSGLPALRPKWGCGSSGVTKRHRRRDAEREEAANAVFTADRVDGREAELA
jgi:hypothetical protein